MAKLASVLNRKVIQNLRTSKNDEQIRAILPSSAAMGEIIVQLPEASGETALWTLASGGTQAVKFIGEEKIKGLIGAANHEVDVVEASVGLEGNGSLPSGWTEGTHNFGDATNVIGAVKNVDAALYSLSGVVSDFSGATVAEIGRLDSRIDGLDKVASSADGQVVITVVQKDGLVSEEKANVKDLQLGGYAKSSASGDVQTNDTINEAISRLENNIAASQAATTVRSSDSSITVSLSAEGTDIKVNLDENDKVLVRDAQNGKISTNIKLSALTAEEISALSDLNVREAYHLLGSKGDVLGDVIKIYKDSSLYRAYLGHVDDTITSPSDPTVVSGSGDTALCFIYLKTDGTYQLVAVNVSKFIEESEFGDGLQVVDHVVSVKKDANSEAFLTVSSDGVKISGVQDAINAAQASAKTEIGTTVLGENAANLTITKDSTSGHDVYTFGLAGLATSADVNTIIEGLDAGLSATSSDNHVEVRVAEEDGKLSSVVVLTSDIASESALTAEIARAKSAETAIDGAVGLTKGEGEARTWDASGSYVSGSTVKADVEILDSLIGIYGVDSAHTEFSSSNTIAKSISEIKDALAQLGGDAVKSVTADGDGKYVYAHATDVDGNVTIAISARTQAIASATSADTALADAYDVKMFAVSAVKDDATNGGLTKIAVLEDGGVMKLDVSELCVDCGEF